MSRLLLLTVIVALIAGACGGITPSRPPSAASSRPSPVPAATPGSSTTPSTDPVGTASPFPADGEWGALELPPLDPVASLEPTKAGSNRVAADTEFRLKSLDGTPVAELAKHLAVEPAVQLVASTPSADQITLRPASRLQAGQAYRFTLTRVDGSIAHRWTVTAATALRLVGTIPGDQTRDVPTNSAIEMTFDQSGVTASAVKSHFSIAPAVKGRFEVHGRSVAFIPNDPLKKTTIYTVTIRKGLPLEGTGQSLPADATFRFETSTGTSRSDTEMTISGTLLDFAVDRAPIVQLRFDRREADQQVKLPKSIAVSVHRLPSVDATTAAWKRLSGDLSWAVSGGAPVRTNGLTQVVDATLSVQRLTGDDWSASALLRLPDPLPRGWYVLTATYEGRRQQVLLQIANIAAYAQVTTTRSVVWVNSVGSGRPIPEATVEIAGTAMGRTDAEGLRVATTPTSVRRAIDAGPTFAIVRAEGRTLIVPLGSMGCGKCWDVGSSLEGEASADPDAWWSVLAVDRQVFRPTDRIDLWGVVKDRSAGTVPDQVEVSIEADDEWNATTPPIVRRTATPVSTGMFSIDVPLVDAPVGDYDLVLRAGGTILASRYIRVEPITKPAYTLSVETNKHAVLTGQSIRATVDATFFEGTPVSGVDLRVGGPEYVDEEGGEQGVAAKTDVNGRATASMRMAMENVDDSDQWTWVYVGARPSLPEEADIQGATHVATFRSTALLDGGAVLTGPTLAVTGAVHAVDFAKMNRLSGRDWDVDPRGAPRVGVRVKVTVTEVIPIRHRAGTYYDPISKTTRPTYEYSERTVDLGTRTARTRQDGSFRISQTVDAKHSYRVRVTYTDEGGRKIAVETWAGPDDPSNEEPAGINIIGAVSSDGIEEAYAVGETVRAEMTGGHPKPAVDRYLFLVAARGLRIAEVQAGPVFTTTFRAPWIPSAAIRAVRFTGAFYDVAEYPATVSFDEGTRALDVSVKADRSRYEPGDTVRLAVRVTDPRGRPVAASVALRAVDEKLYAMGFAEDTDLLAALYAGASDGVLATGVSHGARGEGAGEGDTTGGGGDEPRADFQDAILLRVVTTGRDGRASISFPLSDDLTSWHVSAAALDADMRAGSSSKLIPVGLPFFVEATLAQEYLAGDRPVLRVRGYGSDLKADADVRFTISSATLGMAERSVNARAFEAASVPLPTMTVGTHQVRIAAVTGTGPARHEDVLVRTITVVAHRAVVATSASGPLTEEFELQGGETGFTRIVLADGGRGRVVPGLLATVGVEPGRADTALAASLARRVLVDGFGMADDEFESMDAGAVSAFQPNSGVSLLPYGSEDLDLSALAALADDPGLDVDRLRDYFVEVVEAEEGQVTRERRIVALAGRAALGEAVLDEVREASAAPKLSLVERGWLALAALAAGDESLATSLERGLLEDAGQRLGPWARVVATDREETATLTALVAITAAGVGDPLAADLDAYLSSVPPTDTLVDLQRALAARSWAERTPAGDAVAQLTLDGAPRRLEIRASEPVLVSLTPAQLRTAGLAPVSGSVVVTTTWEGPLDPGSLEAHGIDGFSRTLKPAGKIGLTDVVIVEYRVRYGADGDLVSWLVSDFVPSGLAPIVSGGRLYDAEGNAPDIEGPWRVVGQRVDFTIAQRPDHATSTLRYLARVVTPGTYAWERVAIQSSIAPTWGRTVPATSLEIAAK